MEENARYVMMCNLNIIKFLSLIISMAVIWITHYLKDFRVLLLYFSESQVLPGKLTVRLSIVMYNSDYFRITKIEC